MVKEEFFNLIFEIDSEDVKCYFNQKEVKGELAKELYMIKKKYDEKNERLKKRTKLFTKKKETYTKTLENQIAHMNSQKEHIRRAEAKLAEYKNTILAFGKLATCNSISK